MSAINPCNPCNPCLIYTLGKILMTHPLRSFEFAARPQLPLSRFMTHSLAMWVKKFSYEKMY